MMTLERPDLSHVDPQILAYIEALEAELVELRSSSRSQRVSLEPAEPTEPPTTDCLIVMSKNGSIKRTYRHLYDRQRRSGMGIFDLETPEDDPPAFVSLADENADLLLITDLGRAYRLPVSALSPAQIRDRGQSIKNFINIQTDENFCLMLPARDEGYLAILSERGYVRLLRHNYIGEKMRPGTPIFDVSRFGSVAYGSWTTGENELFIATRSGKGIRFREKMVHANGSLGIRLDRGDDVVGITGVTPDSGVLLLGADGKGTIRLMSGFSANKAPGSGGKIAINTDHLIGAVAINHSDDIFAISRLSKIIRFQASEIPPKEGVVQGVICMSLRADEVSTFTVCPLP
jgi:DNA gyrase subunit A